MEGLGRAVPRILTHFMGIYFTKKKPISFNVKAKFMLRHGMSIVDREGPGAPQNRQVFSGHLVSIDCEHLCYQFTGHSLCRSKPTSWIGRIYLSPPLVCLPSNVRSPGPFPFDLSASVSHGIKIQKASPWLSDEAKAVFDEEMTPTFGSMGCPSRTRIYLSVNPNGMAPKRRKSGCTMAQRYAETAPKPYTYANSLINRKFAQKQEHSVFS